jgi:CBS-domain-containing membrane protein
MTAQNLSPGNGTGDLKQSRSARFKADNNLLHYAAYFIAVGSLVFIAQTDEPKQIENAVLAGAIASGAVVSRDWYKARLDPDMAADPTALIGLFNEMLHAGRAQANVNAAHLKRVEFLQADLVEAMRDFNDMLRLNPAEVEQRLREIQTANLTSALPPLNISYPPGTNGINNAAEPSLGVTHVPESATLRQSDRLRRPGFDA